MKMGLLCLAVTKHASVPKMRIIKVNSVYNTERICNITLYGMPFHTSFNYLTAGVPRHVFNSYNFLPANMGEERKVYKVMVGKPEGKRPLQRPRCRWEERIRMDLR
jgi:hypothetical protein